MEKFFCVKSVWFGNNKCWPFCKCQYSRSNVSRIFEEYATNVCFKNIPRISPEYYKLWKYFWKSKSSKNWLVGYPVKILILAVSSLAMFLWTLLKPFYI